MCSVSQNHNVFSDNNPGCSYKDNPIKKRKTAFQCETVWPISVSNTTQLAGKTVTLKSNIGTENICFTFKISGLSIYDVMLYFFTQIYHGMTKKLSSSV